MGTKKQIRREILSIRDALSKEERKKKSDRIKKRLAELPVFEQADQLLIYAGYGSEVETDAIMDLAFRKRKLVFCPRVEGKKMQFYQITDLSQLVSGYRSIRGRGSRNRGILSSCPERCLTKRETGSDTAAVFMTDFWRHIRRFLQRRSHMNCSLWNRDGSRRKKRIKSPHAL